jgi:hypothetical protein
VILADRALIGAHRIGRRRVIVIARDFDLPAIDASMSIDFIRRQLGRTRNRRSGNRLRLGDDGDPQRLFVGGPCRCAALRARIIAAKYLSLDPDRHMKSIPADVGC